MHLSKEMILSQSVDILLENIELFAEPVNDVLFQCSDGQVGFHQSLLASMSPFLASILNSISCCSSSSTSSFSSGEPLVIILDGVKTEAIETLKTCIFNGNGSSTKSSTDKTKFTFNSKSQHGDLEEVLKILGFRDRPSAKPWQPWQKETKEEEKPKEIDSREIELLIEAEEIRLTKIVMGKMDEIMNGGKGIRCSECDKILSTHRVLPHYKKHIDHIPKKYVKKKGGRPKKEKEKLKEKEVPSPKFLIKHAEKIKKVPKKRGRKRLNCGEDEVGKIAPQPQIKLSFSLEDVGQGNGANLKEINLQELGKKKRGRPKRPIEADAPDSINKIQKMTHPDNLMPINMTKKELDVKDAKQEFDHFSAATGVTISFPEKYLKHVYTTGNSDSTEDKEEEGVQEKFENGRYASGSSSASSVNEDYDDSLSDDENALVMDLKEDENDDL